MKKYNQIVQHYEACYKKHGDNHLGMDWPNLKDVITRFDIMLDVIKFDSINPHNENKRLLDFGCGTGHLLQFINDIDYKEIIYSGSDISNLFIEKCKEKYPNNEFYCLDILEKPQILPQFDYIVMNGVFTEKREMTFEEMWNYFSHTVKAVFSKAERGIAFNVMSKNVDWERDDLFHVSLDLLTNFLTKELSRNFIIRNDYRLYEYTVYLYK